MIDPIRLAAQVEKPVEKTHQKSLIDFTKSNSSITTKLNANQIGIENYNCLNMKV